MIKHAAEQYRIISSRSINTEKEESAFNLIKTTNNTLNPCPSHVINNAFITIHVSEKSTGFKNINIIQTDEESVV